MRLYKHNKMTRKRKPIAIIPRFADIPRDVVIAILEYDDRFYLSNDGYTIITRFARNDYRYILLARIPKINYVWSYHYEGGNMISYLISTAFLSKNKWRRYSITYYLDFPEDGALVDRNERMTLRKVVFKNQRKVVFKNHSHSEAVFYF